MAVTTWHEVKDWKLLRAQNRVVITAIAKDKEGEDVS